jgi:hypothetical protein
LGFQQIFTLFAAFQVASWVILAPCAEARRAMQRRAYLSRLETTQRYESAGLGVRLTYTSSTPTHTNNGEQTRDILREKLQFCRHS